MNNEDNIIEAKGLNRNSNDIILPAGSLIAGDECVVVKDNIISRRRGFKLCNESLPIAKPDQMFVSGGTLYVNINGLLYYENASGFSCRWDIVDNAGPRFNVPWGIWGNATDLYICDSSNSTIRKLNFASQYVSTFAGTAGAAGSADGVGAAARFRQPYGIWGDATNLYVCDFGNETIRQIVIATATVSTFAGTAGAAGSADGVGAAARFSSPSGIWGDGTSLFVGDTVNSTIRQIDIATATVSTLAGTAGATGSTDGVGAAARFDHPTGVAGNGGNLYVADSVNNTIRKIVVGTATVSTVAGTAGASGYVNGTGAAARFNTPLLLFNDGTNLYIADFANGAMRKMVLASSAVSTVVDSSIGVFSTPVGIYGTGTDYYVTGGNADIYYVDLTIPSATLYAGVLFTTGSNDGYLFGLIEAPI